MWVNGKIRKIFVKTDDLAIICKNPDTVSVAWNVLDFYDMVKPAKSFVGGGWIFRQRCRSVFCECPFPSGGMEAAENLSEPMAKMWRR